MSADPETAATGWVPRCGAPVVLAIDAEGMAKRGFVFYRAAHGFWLTKHVPPKWISRMR